MNGATFNLGFCVDIQNSVVFANKYPAQPSQIAISVNFCEHSWSGFVSDLSLLP